jgi:hypothetical protein
MNNKFILAISSLFCIATFAVAQDAPAPAPEQTAPEAAVTAPEPEASPAEQPAAPAPEAEPQVSAPAPTQTAEQPAQTNEVAPVVFYYAPTAPGNEPVQNPAQVENVPPAPQPVIEQYKPKVHPKQTTHYGIQGSIGTSTYSGDSNADFDDGLGWNAGAYINLPISDYIFSFELGSQFIYRKVSNSFTQTNRNTYETEARKDKITAYSLGFPILMNINAGRSGLLYFGMGVEFEVPLYNNLQISIDGKKRVDQDLQEDHCAPMSWDILLGMGINATSHFGLYTRMNIGISDIYDDLYIKEDGKKEYWGFKTFDLNIGLKIFI